MALKRLAVLQNKGGVGKTSTVKLLGEFYGLIPELSETRVLILDLDPQCNLSQRFLSMEYTDGRIPPIHPDSEDAGERFSTASIFEGVAFAPYSTRYPNIDILPGSEKGLLAAERVSEAELQQKIQNRLQMLLSLPEFEEAYDLVLIDTPPTKGPLTISAFRGATHALFPLQPEIQCQEGLLGMIQLWKEQNAYRLTPLQIVGILPNLVRKGVSLHRDVLDAIRQDVVLSNYLLNSVIYQRTAIAGSDDPQMEPRSLLDPSSGSDKSIREELLTVCWEIHNKVFTS